VTVSSVI